MTGKSRKTLINGLLTSHLYQENKYALGKRSNFNQQKFVTPRDLIGLSFYISVLS